MIGNVKRFDYRTITVKEVFRVIRKLIATGAGIVAAAVATLPVHACGNCGCGIGSNAGFNILGYGWPVVGAQFAPLTSLFGMGAMLPNWGCGWGWW
jgi:hypothetical protein